MNRGQQGFEQHFGRRSMLMLAGVSAVAGLSACSGTKEPPADTQSFSGATGTLAPGLRLIASGLQTPWSMVRHGDGSMLVSERDTAMIKRIDPQGNVSDFAQVPGVVPGGEVGLLGLELWQSEGTQWLYAYITAESDNRVVRFELPQNSSGSVALGQGQLLVRGIKKSSIHNGGRIKFGPDHLLYVGTGDASDAQLAQDPRSLNGKILRVHPDGSIPGDNPLTDSPVYSLGHRNVQGLAWDSTGVLWASELGPDRNDELNVIRAGGNYGWPLVTGAPHRAGLLDAAYVWKSTAEASPSALAIINDVAFVAALRGERLWRLQLSVAPKEPSAATAEVALGGQGRLRDVLMQGPEELLIATNEGANSRILALTI